MLHDLTTATVVQHFCIYKDSAATTVNATVNATAFPRTGLPCGQSQHRTGLLQEGLQLLFRSI